MNRPNKLCPGAYIVPENLIDEHLKALDTYEFTVLSVIIRMIEGWGKTSDRISISQFEALIPQISRSTIIRKLKSLGEKGFISTIKHPNLNEYALSERFYREAYENGSGVTETPSGVRETPLSSVTETPLAPGSVRETPLSGVRERPTSVTETPIGVRETPTIVSAAVKEQQTEQHSRDGTQGESAAAANLNFELQKIGFTSGDVDSLFARYGQPVVDRELQRLQHGLRYPGWAGKIRSKGAWLRGSLKNRQETGSGYSIPEPEKFRTRQQRKQARPKKQSRVTGNHDSPPARTDATAPDAKKRQQENTHWEAIYQSLPESEQAKIDSDTMTFLQSSNPFAYQLLVAKQKSGGWQDSPLYSAEYLSERNNLLRTRYGESVDLAAKASGKTSGEGKDIGNLIGKSLSDARRKWKAGASS